MDPREAKVESGGSAAAVKFTSLLYVTAEGGSSEQVDMAGAAALLKAGTLQDATLVWTEGMPAWTELGKCRDRFAWPTTGSSWAETDVALVERRVAELRQTWDALPDDDLLYLLDELDQYPENEVEAQWNSSYQALMAAAPEPEVAPAAAGASAEPSEGIPPAAAFAGWDADARSQIESRVAELRCGWDSVPDDDLLEVLDEMEARGKTDDEVGSCWDAAWAQLRAKEDEAAVAAPAPSSPAAVDFKSIVGL